MVGRNRIAENCQRFRGFDVRKRTCFHRKAFKKRRFLNVGRISVPIINRACRRWNFVPKRILLGKFAIKFFVSFGIERRLKLFFNFIERSPNVFQKYVISLFVLSNRLKINVFQNRSRKRVSHNQRRRHQEICFDVLMNTRLKITIARQNRSRNQIVFKNRFFNAWVKRSRITDAIMHGKSSGDKSVNFIDR